jgi:hypothetical protein
VGQGWIIFDLNEISKQYCIDLSKSIFFHLNVINLLCSIGINWWLVIQELALTVGGSL